MGSMRFNGVRFTSIMVAAVLAGCLDGAPPVADGDDPIVAPADVWGAVRELLEGVPCDVADVGKGTSENLKKLADVEFEGTLHGEVDIRGDLALVARYNDGGFQIVNISDPLAPEVVGVFTEAGGGLDVKFSPDNLTGLVGVEGGIVMADLSDPTDPKPAGEWKFPTRGTLTQNAHMLYTARIADEDWVFVAPNDNNGVWILKLEGPAAERTLTYVTRTLPVEGGPLGPHDMFVTRDPVTNRWMLYSADGFHGWTVFDVTDPTQPTRAGGFVNPAEGGYTHTIQSAQIGSRRFVATISEVGLNVLRVYDATILRAPLLLGVWQADPGLGSTTPQHNFNIVAGKLYLAHYDHGVYVFDLTKLGPAPIAGTASLSPVAHYAEDAKGVSGPLAFDSYWDVVLKDGLLYANHMTKGLRIIGYGCNEPGDATLTSIG